MTDETEAALRAQLADLRDQLADLRDQLAERDHTIWHLRPLLGRAQAVNPLRRQAHAA